MHIKLYVQYPFSIVIVQINSILAVLQPRSQGLSSYRPLERANELSSFAPWGGKMKDPENEIGTVDASYL